MGARARRQATQEGGGAVTQQIKYNGTVHNFPDDFTEQDISDALAAEGGQVQSVTPVEPGKYSPEQQAAAQEYIKQMQAPKSPGLVAWAQGALQGYGDEMGGAVRSLLGGDSYTEERDRARQVIGAAEEVAPTGAKLAGNLSSAIPAAAATGGTSLLAQMGLGGLFSGVNAYGETAENDMQGVADVGVGTGLGMIGGAAGYGAGKLLQSFTARGLAFDTIKEAMAGKVDDLIAGVKRLGGSAAEADEVVREVLRQQAAKNSVAATAAQGTARQRLADVNKQVVQSIDDLISPENVSAFTKRTQDATRQSVRPNYAMTEAQPAGAIPAQVSSLPAYDDALAAAKELASFEKRAFDPDNLTVKDLDVMQRFLRLSKEKSFQGTALDTMKGATYGNTREAVNDLAKSVSPELASAQQAVAVQKSVEEATDLGKSALNSNKEWTEVAEEFAALSPEAQEGYRSAFASRLRAQLAATKGAKGTKANISTVLDKPGVVDKMKALGFPADEIDAIIERGAGARGVLDALTGGSQTARLQAAAKASQSPLSQLQAGDLVAGALTHPAAVVAMPASRAAGNAQEREVARMIIDALTSQDPAKLQSLLRYAPQNTTMPILRALGISSGPAIETGLTQ
jgi:hypothetical protein